MMQKLNLSLLFIGLTLFSASAHSSSDPWYDARDVRSAVEGCVLGNSSYSGLLTETYETFRQRRFNYLFQSTIYYGHFLQVGESRHKSPSLDSKDGIRLNWAAIATGLGKDLTNEEVEARIRARISNPNLVSDEYNYGCRECDLFKTSYLNISTSFGSAEFKPVVPLPQISYEREMVDRKGDELGRLVDERKLYQGISVWVPVLPQGVSLNSVPLINYTTGLPPIPPNRFSLNFECYISCLETELQKLPEVTPGNWSTGNP